MGKEKHTEGTLLAVDAGAKMTAADKKRLKKYQSARGEATTAKGVDKPHLKRHIKRNEAKIDKATKRAAQAEVLLPSEAGYLEAEGMERTSRFTQFQVAAAVDVQTQSKAYNVSLEQLGPYRACFTADSRRLLLGGRKGHIVVARWDGFKILHELQVLLLLVALLLLT